MRPAQKSNRSRGRGNRKSGGGGNNINRVYDSAGPEGKVRGTPQQIIDKYVSLARDAQTSGDRVASENFLQHAEHYQRILITAMGAQEQARRDQGGQEQPSTDEQPAPQQADAQPQPNGDGAQPAPEAVAEAPQPAPEPAAKAAPQSEIGGMAMIDATPDQPDLLVDSEDLTAIPAKPNGTRRRRKPAAKPAEAEAPPAEAAADAPEAAAEG